MVPSSFEHRIEPPRPANELLDRALQFGLVGQRPLSGVDVSQGALQIVRSVRQPECAFTILAPLGPPADRDGFYFVVGDLGPVSGLGQFENAIGLDDVSLDQAPRFAWVGAQRLGKLLLADDIPEPLGDRPPEPVGSGRFESHRFPLSPRVRRWKAILDKLKPF
jgi:hypothetical protein